MVLGQGAAQILTQGSAGFCQPEHIPWPCCYQHLSQLGQSYLDSVHSSSMTLGSSVDMGCSNSLFEIRISYCWTYTGTFLPVQTALASSGFGTGEREAVRGAGHPGLPQDAVESSSEELERFWDGREELCCPCCCSPRCSGPIVQHFPCCGTGPQLLLGWLIPLVAVGNE